MYVFEFSPGLGFTEWHCYEYSCMRLSVNRSTRFYWELLGNRDGMFRFSKHYRTDFQNVQQHTEVLEAPQPKRLILNSSPLDTPAQMNGLRCSPTVRATPPTTAGNKRWRGCAVSSLKTSEKLVQDSGGGGLAGLLCFVRC